MSKQKRKEAILKAIKEEKPKEIVSAVVDFARHDPATIKELTKAVKVIKEKEVLRPQLEGVIVELGLHECLRKPKSKFYAEREVNCEVCNAIKKLELLLGGGDDKRATRSARKVNKK